MPHSPGVATKPEPEDGEADRAGEEGGRGLAERLGTALGTRLPLADTGRDEEAAFRSRRDSVLWGEATAEVPAAGVALAERAAEPGCC